MKPSYLKKSFIIQVIISFLFILSSLWLNTKVFSQGNLNQGCNNNLKNIVVGAGSSSTPQVKIFNGMDNSLLNNFLAYDNTFTGGVRVAIGDVNGDGTQDIITGSGSGSSPLVKIYDGSTLALLNTFSAYEDKFTGGVFVASGDINKDGFFDVITSGGETSIPEVKIFSGKDNSLIKSFLAYDVGFSGGVQVASNDVNNDGFADIITAPGISGGSQIKIFDNSGMLLSSFIAYTSDFKSAVFVASSDVNNDGFADIVTAPGEGYAPQVKIFSGKDNSLITTFLAYETVFTDGVRVASSDVDGDGVSEIITGPGGNAQVKIFNINGTELSNFNAFPNGSVSDVFVAAGNNCSQTNSSISTLSSSSSSGLTNNAMSTPATLEIKRGKVEDGTPKVLPIDVTISKNNQIATYSIYINEGKTFEVQYEYPLSKPNPQGEKQRSSFEEFNAKDAKKVKRLQRCLFNEISDDEKKFPNENIILKPAVIGNIIQDCIILNKLITSRKLAMVAEPAFIELCSCEGNNTSSSGNCVCGINSLCMNGLCSSEPSCSCMDLQCNCLLDNVCLRGSCLDCPGERPHRCPNGVCVSDVSMCRTLDPEQCPDGLEPCIPPFNEYCVAENCSCPLEVENCSSFVSFLYCEDGTCPVMDCSRIRNDSHLTCPRGPEIGCTRRRPFICNYDSSRVFSSVYLLYPVCVNDLSLCPACPLNYINCPNNTCIPQGADCTCPLSSPYRYPSDNMCHSEPE